MQKHGEERKNADHERQDRNTEDRCLQSLFRQSSDRGEASAPQIANRPSVLPNCYDGRQHAATDQAKPKVVRCLWKVGLTIPRQLAEMIKKLDNRKAEPDQ